MLEAVITTGLLPQMLLLDVAGMVPSCLLLRMMVRLRVSVVCLRIIAPRTRLRTLGSACAVFDGARCGLQNVKLIY